MKRKNSDRRFQARLRAGRKAVQYVHDKTEEREQVMRTFLTFPDIEAPDDFIKNFLDSKEDL
ncbi:hypothetical protein [Parabacteroides distasonis]|uniref:hypothetical protein n=1 Tax=Parabacteroides distasonis TaxID=823 RepID=UPI003F1F2FA1